jgi:hypothetical protein
MGRVMVKEVKGKQLVFLITNFTLPPQRIASFSLEPDFSELYVRRPSWRSNVRISLVAK